MHAVRHIPGQVLQGPHARHVRAGTLVENGGGVIRFDEAACSIIVLEAMAH